eukprot:14142956-Alexandrium_andersonii.AAC.1
MARLEKRARACRAGLERQDGCISDVAYDAVWLGKHERQALAWFARKSQERRWWPTDLSLIHI